MKKRFLALAMVLIFCVGLMSMAALAADEDAVTAEETIEAITVEAMEEEDAVAEEDPAAPVTDGAVATVNGTDYDSFDSAINAGTGSTVILQSDVSHESNPCMIGGTITLDLNGYTITGPNGRALFQLNSPAVLTIEDSSADGSGTITKYGRTFRLNQGVTIIINGGNFTDTGSAGQMMGPLAVEGSGVTIEINDGVFSNNYYDSYVTSSSSATYTLADSLAGFRVNVASGGTATLNGIWTDSSGAEYTDATVTAADTYTFVGNVEDDSENDTDDTDDETDDNNETDTGDEDANDDTSVGTDDTGDDTAEEVTGTLASVSVSGYMTFDSVTITVDGVEYELEEDVHYTYVSEGDGPNAVLTFYFTDELVSALSAGTYTVTITGDQGPNGTVATDVDLVIDEDTVGGTADDVASDDSGDSEGSGSESGSSDTDSSDADDSSGSGSDSSDADDSSGSGSDNSNNGSDNSNNGSDNSNNGSDNSGSGSSSSNSSDDSNSTGNTGSTGSGSDNSGSGNGNGSGGSGSGSGGSGSGSGSTGSDSDSDFDLSGILDSMTGSGSGSGNGGNGSSMSDILSGLTDGDYSSWGSSGSNSSASGESDSSASDEVATPATGDSNHMAIWCVLLALCGAALIGTSVVLRKRDNG